jgi:hypothetical protein
VSLDNDFYWCAVRDCEPPETLISRLYGPRASVRVPSGEDSLEDIESRAYFQKGSWTFFVAPSEIFDPERHFPVHEVLYLRHAAGFSWASIEHYTNGTCDWSIYGAEEDDHVRVDGEPPPKAKRYLAATSDLTSVAVKVGKALLGFRHDNDVRPDGFHVIDMAPVRRLVVAGVTTDDPTLDDVHAGLRARQPVTLVVGEGDRAKAMLATFEGGQPSVEMHARFKMLARKRGSEAAGGASIDHDDVRVLFETFYPRAGHPFAYEWSVIKDPKPEPR